MQGDAYKQFRTVERNDLAFEIIARGIDDGQMLAFAQPQNTRMLQIIRGKAEGKRLATLRRENLIVEKKSMQGHVSP